MGEMVTKGGHKVLGYQLSTTSKPRAFGILTLLLGIVEKLAITSVLHLGRQGNCGERKTKKKEVNMLSIELPNLVIPVYRKLRQED